MIGTGQADTEFYRSAGILARIPLILPLPRRIEGVVLTTLKDVLWALDQALKSKNDGVTACRIIDLMSTTPTSGANVLEAMDTKVWGSRRFMLKGFIGNALFRWAENKFGTARSGEPKMTDYFAASTVCLKSSAPGLPGTVLASTMGHPTNVLDAL